MPLFVWYHGLYGTYVLPTFSQAGVQVSILNVRHGVLVRHVETGLRGQKLYKILGTKH